MNLKLIWCFRLIMQPIFCSTLQNVKTQATKSLGLVCTLVLAFHRSRDLITLIKRFLDWTLPRLSWIHFTLIWPISNVIFNSIIRLNVANSLPLSGCRNEILYEFLITSTAVKRLLGSAKGLCFMRSEECAEPDQMAEPSPRLTTGRCPFALSCTFVSINPLALELDIYSLAQNLCKVRIFYEPRRVTLGNTRHFVEEWTKIVREILKK